MRWFAEGLHPDVKAKADAEGRSLEQRFALCGDGVLSAIVEHFDTESRVGWYLTLTWFGSSNTPEPERRLVTEREAKAALIDLVPSVERWVGWVNPSDPLVTHFTEPHLVRFVRPDSAPD